MGALPINGEPLFLDHDPDTKVQTFAEACVDFLESRSGRRSARRANGLSLAAWKKLAGDAMPGHLGEIEAALNTALIRKNHAALFADFLWLGLHLPAV